MNDDVIIGEHEDSWDDYGLRRSYHRSSRRSRSRFGMRESGRRSAQINLREIGKRARRPGKCKWQPKRV